MVGISLHKISRVTPPKQAVMVPNAIQITGCKPIMIPFSRPIKVKTPRPMVSNKNSEVRSLSNFF